MSNTKHIVLRPQDILALEALWFGYSTATHHVAHALDKLGGFWGGNCAKARNVLRYLERHGMVRGSGYLNRPPVRWWTITDAGREAVEATRR